MFQLTPNDWNDLPVLGTIVVPADWIDFMGHMNVMWYTHLFGKGVLEFFQLVGLTQEYFTANNAGCFVLEQHIRYLAEVRVGETVSLRVRAVSRSEKRLHFIVLMIKEGNRVMAATSEIITAHIDMSRRRTSPIPELIMTAIDKTLLTHSQLSWPAPVNGLMHA
jgi:acyl-CoA thioester hydrolase